MEETKESKLIKLLSGKKYYTPAEIMKHTGYSEASVGMYLSQAYLDRKGKPYKVVEEGGKYRYEAKKVKK